MLTAWLSFAIPRYTVTSLWSCLSFQSIKSSPLSMTHSQIRPIFVFIFSKLHFFHELRKTVFIVGFFKFYSFPIEVIRKICSSKKYCHFWRKTAFILHKNKSLILAPFYYAKFTQFLCKNGNIFGCYSFFYQFFGPWTLWESYKILIN